MTWFCILPSRIAIDVVKGSKVKGIIWIMAKVRDLKIFIKQWRRSVTECLMIIFHHFHFLNLVVAYGNSWTLDTRVGGWTLEAGLWKLDSGRWTLGAGPWTLDPGPWTLDPGLWTLDSGLWTLDSRRWTMDAGLWTLDSGRRTLSLTVVEQNQNPVSFLLD